MYLKVFLKVYERYILKVQKCTLDGTRPEKMNTHTHTLMITVVNKSYA